MKRIFVITVLLLSCLSTASAHAPLEMDLSYNETTSVLRVEFIHKVRNRSDHFIDRVSVRLNGEEVIEQRLSLQETKDGGTLLYKMADAAEDDEIEVLLDCVKGGKMKKSITVEKQRD